MMKNNIWEQLMEESDRFSNHKIISGDGPIEYYSLEAVESELNIYSECEYGYGPITPCDIYLGDERAGRIDGNINYRLDSSRLNVHTALKKGYANLEVYKEATDIIISKLNEGL